MQCPECSRESAEDAAFCAGCGTRLVRSCASCGRALEPEARFCSGCGTPVQPGRTATAPSGEPPPTLIAPSHPPAAPALEAVGAGRYRIARLLGEGANKKVYLARDTRLDRDVALAEIKSVVLDEAGRARLQRETQAMAQLGDHSGIVTVHDVLDEEGRLFIVSQYMAGGDLSQHLAARPDRRLPPDEASAIALQVVSALEHAHGRRVIHRDIKPSNIWLASDGAAKLGDFGLAFALDRTRLTQEGMMVGTAAYMPPEQALGQLPDTRSDLYALGATLYEMVTGRPPFVGDDAVAIITQHIQTRPVAPHLLGADVPAGLERLILALLEKDPTARPESATLVRQRLEESRSAATSGSATAATSGANPLDRLASGVFVGREQEVARGRALFDDSFAGQPRIMLLVGEPGIGKTRVSEELTTYARIRGAQVFWGRCHEGEGAPPFWPWVQIVRSYAAAREPSQLRRDLGLGAPEIAGLVSEVRQVLPDLAEPLRLDPEQARFRLFDAVVGFLRNAAQRSALVLVLDDLHWADKPSLLLLEFLARELGPARLFVIATYRDVELRRRHPLAETLAELSRLQIGERVLLRGLTEADVARFLEQSANISAPQALVTAIYRETEGNPFFVHEVVRLLTSDGRLSSEWKGESWSLEIPQGVREVVGRRLNRLSEACNELLLVASVLGREFSLPALEQVGGIEGDSVLQALDEALAARVISEVPGPVPTYRFSHALMRETLHEELSTPRRVKLHRRAGEVLEAMHGSDSGAHLAEIAHHFYQAVQSGDLDRVVEASIRAAEWAGERQAFEEEAEHYERATQVLELETEPDAGLLCELSVRLARAQALSGNSDRARQTALRAAEMARNIDSRERLARAALAYGEGFVVVELGRVDETAVGLLEEARQALAGSVDRAGRELRALVSARLAQELYFGGDIQRIEAMVEEAASIAEDLDDAGLRSVALQARTFNLSSDRIEQMQDLAVELQELAREARDTQLESSGRLYEVSSSLFRGDRPTLLATIEAEERLARESRLPLVRAMPLWHRATQAVMEGRFTEFRPLMSEAVHLLSGGAGTNARQWGGMLLYVAGRHLGVLRVTEESLGFVERYPDYPVYRAYLAAIYVAIGELDTARVHLDRIARDGFATIPRDYNRISTLALAADVAHGLSDRDLAQTLYQLLLPWAGRHAPGGAGVSYLGPFDQRLGMLASLLGDQQRAVAHLRDAADATERLGARCFEAECRTRLARVLASDGPGQDSDAARREIDRALELARPLGMAQLATEAEELRAGL